MNDVTSGVVNKSILGKKPSTLDTEGADAIEEDKLKRNVNHPRREIYST